MTCNNTEFIDYIEQLKQNRNSIVGLQNEITELLFGTGKNPHTIGMKVS